jgi:pSer/pThr/pTyr-binding forkhead associated (FHA) protein
VDLKITMNCEIEGQEKTWDLEFTQDLITIGRHSRNDIQIPDLQVSADHARIIVEGDVAWLVDLGSGAGTVIDGTLVGPGSRTRVREGSEVRIANYSLKIGRPARALDETTSERTSMVAMNMVKEVLGSFAESREPPVFEVMNDDELGRTLVIKEEEREYRVGRDSEGDLVLRHWSISRKHLMIRRVGGATTVMDMGSKNGCLLNGERLSEPAKVRDGDVVSVGHTELKFRDPEGGLLDSMDATPTPATHLADLGLDLAALHGKVEQKAPPREERRPAAPPPREQPKPATREAAPPAPPTPQNKPSRNDSSFADYLPIILGVILLLCALAAGYFLFLKA